MNGLTQYIWIVDVFLIAFLYTVIALLFSVVIYKKQNGKWIQKKNRQRSVERNQLQRELFFSLITMLIYALVGYGMYRLRAAGATKVYLDIHDKGWVYFFLSMPIMVFLHDAYFYWTHRLLHMPFFFRSIHRLHHLSGEPTPWSAFSFHPIEAVIQAGIVPIIVLLLPTHPFALFIFLGYMTFINVAGHCGYEILPERFRTGIPGRWQNTTSAHDRHHAESRYNYGLYFTFWDQLMGTGKKLQ